MSISKMKKLAVFAYKDELDPIVKRLMRLRCVDISTHTDRDEEEELELERISCDSRRLELESTIADIDAVIAALDPHVKRAKGMLAGKIKCLTNKTPASAARSRAPYRRRQRTNSGKRLRHADRYRRPSSPP